MGLNKSKGNGHYKNKDWLTQKYIHEKINMVELSLLAGCCYVTLWKWMNILKIKRRPPGQNKNFLQRKHIYLDVSQVAFINGLVLGDGSIGVYGKNQNKTAHYEHGDKRYEYIGWLLNKFKDIGFVCGKITPISNRGYKFKTNSYAELYDLYRQWYPGGAKKIPTGLKLTPTILKNWYIGDGNYSRCPLIDSATFPIGSIEKLIRPLNEAGINHSLRSFKSRNRVRISSKSTPAFFRYILSEDPEIPPKYKYKFPEEYHAIK